MTEEAATRRTTVTEEAATTTTSTSKSSKEPSRLEHDGTGPDPMGGGISRVDWLSLKKSDSD